MATGRFLRSAIVLGAAAFGLLPVAPPAWSASADEVRTAADYFMTQEFELARERVVAVLAGDALPDDLRVQALVLKARCDVALAGGSAGTDAFCSVLALRPTWRPPDDETYTQAEWASYHRALDLCGPLVVGSPVVEPLPRSLLLDRARREREPEPRVSGESRPWYRNPYLLGAAGGIAAGALLLMIEEAPPPPPLQLPDFPEPPE